MSEKNVKVLKTGLNNWKIPAWNKFGFEVWKQKNLPENFEKAFHLINPLIQKIMTYNDFLAK